MQRPVTIKRLDPDSDPHSYASLRKSGIEYVQQLSGNDWTDYNVHDPGVTILEQLCFQITELLYRSGFAVEDFLASAAGDLDLARQGLARPHEIFPCRPATPTDLRLTILGAIPELDDVWVEPGGDGVMRISVCIRPEAAKHREGILDRVRKVCHRSRNLCEDFVHDVAVVPRRRYTLHAKIEIADEHRLNKILGEVYVTASRYVAGALRYESFRRALKSGQTFDGVFSGPLLAQGIVTERSLAAADQPVQIAELLSLLQSIDGIAQIDDLYLETGGIEYRQTLPRFDGDAYATLDLPAESAADIDVIARVRGRELRPDVSAVTRYIDELIFSDEASQRSRKSIESLYAVPDACERHFDQYTSVQDLLPPLYGVGRIGTPASSRPAQRARLRQLKGFLLVFDQVLADFAAGLDHVGELFSIEPTVDRSYVCKPIGDDIVAGADSLFEQPQTAFLSELTRRGDNFGRRRNRVLDCLLALYGESFPDSGLKSCATYSDGDELDREIIASKLVFLRNVARLTRNRGAGFDYSRPCWGTFNLSGLQARLSLLLGLRDIRERSLLRPFLDLHVRLLRHDRFLESEPGRVAITDLEIDDTFTRIPELPEESHRELQEWRRRAAGLRIFRDDRLSEALLRRGIRLEHYRLGTLEGNPGLHLVLQPEAGSRWWLIASVADGQAGIEMAHGLRSLLARLNRHSEGMHVVEHLLLRPTRQADEGSTTRISNDPDFFVGRLSIVLPAWTLRGDDRGFRALATQLVREHCPAHVSPEVLWLDYNEMYRFEGLYSLWLKKKGQRPGGSAEIDDIADELARFLVTRDDFAPDVDGVRRYV